MRHSYQASEPQLLKTVPPGAGALQRVSQEEPVARDEGVAPAHPKQRKPAQQQRLNTAKKHNKLIFFLIKN